MPQPPVSIPNAVSARIGPPDDEDEPPPRRWVVPAWLRSPAVLAGFGGGTVLLIALVLLARWLLPDSASVARFQPLLADAIRQQPAAFAEATLCDRSVDYQPRLELDAYDTRRRALEQLVLFGAYEKPQLKTVGDGWNTRTHLIFVATPDGEAALRHGAICAAEGYVVRDVLLTGPRQKSGKLTLMQVQAVLEWQSPKPWARDPGMSKAFPNIQPSRSVLFTMVREHGHWRVASD
ncbi:hypothetical protein [Andreprevotia lacus]|nr:hypothetical protein [Andreprevotia lacus]